MIMNYEHLYAYLDTRPLHEIKACMFKVVNLVRKHSGDLSASDIDSDLDQEEKLILTANQKQSKSRRSKIAQRIWTHQAVLNKFGSRSKDLISPTQASEAVSDLMVLPKVVEYMMSVNNTIDNEVCRKSSNNGKTVPQMPNNVSSTPLTMNTCYSQDHEPEVQDSAKTPKRSRTNSTVVASRPSHEDRTVGSSDVSADEEETEWWVDGNKRKKNNVGDTPGTSTSSTGTVAVTPRGTKRPLESAQTRTRTVWTEDMDNALISAKQQHGAEGWSAVAQAVGYGLNPHQCLNRWNATLAPLLEGKKSGTLNWSDNEVTLLQELVSQHTLPATWNHRRNCLGEERTDWVTIGASLERTPSCCCAKWRSIVHSKMIKGHFTLAEDAYITRKVGEWGDKGIGLWSVLEKEMNRNNLSIMSRWKSLSSRKT